MKPKSVLLGLLTFVTLGAIGAATFVLLWHEPDFYQRSNIPEGRERQVAAGEFIGEFGMFVDKVQHEEPWDARFTEKAINSYFDESFVPSGVAQRVLPEGVSRPRISIEPDRIRLAFRYGTGLMTTVVSIDVRVWVAAQERNVVVLELQGLHAGALPISAQTLQQRVTDMARPQNIDVTWYRHKGNPVALLRFQADRPRPTVHLKQIELRRGFMTIRGSSTEPPTLGAMLPFRAERSDSE
jgi:hypothetical protein